jgi:hypothetical protein
LITTHTPHQQHRLIMDCDYTKLFYASKRELSSIKFFGFFHPFSVALWRSVLNPRTVIKCSFIKLIDKTSRKELKESFFSIIFFLFQHLHILFPIVFSNSRDFVFFLLFCLIPYCKVHKYLFKQFFLLFFFVLLLMMARAK